MENPDTSCLGQRPRGGPKTLEKVMALHSSTLAWKIPWREEPGSGGGRVRVRGVRSREQACGRPQPLADVCAR